MVKFTHILLLIVLPVFLLANESNISWEDTTFTSESGIEVAAQVGYLTVEENRGAKESPSIYLKFVRLLAQTSSPASPILYLEGGPGSSCTWQAGEGWALERWVPLLQLGDVILFDQRGTGEQSERMTWINFEGVADDILISTEAVNRYSKQMVEQALPAFAERGINPTSYTSTASAHDLEELRLALDIEQWHLFGFSYGTHLAFHYLRDFSTAVDKAILIGSEGLDDTFKRPLSMDHFFEQVSTELKKDKAISSTIPDLMALYTAVGKQLSEEPAEITVNNPLTGEKMPIKVGKYGLDFVLFCDLGDASDLPVFPRLLYSISQGDYSVLQWFVQKRIPNFYGIHLMSLSMELSSGASSARLAQIRAEATESRFGATVVTPYLALSEVWPTSKGSNTERDLRSTVPTLFLSGSLDFNTPAYQAASIQKQFPNSTHLTVENAGHEQILTNKTVQQAIAQFLQGKAVDHLAPANPPLRFIPLAGNDSEIWHPSLGERN